MARRWWTWFRCLCRCCSSVSPGFRFVWMAKSSMYTDSHPWAISRRKIMFIIIWKVAGELVSPKNITVGSKSPSGVRNATFHSSPSLMRTLLYLWEKCDAHAGNEWDSSGLWANAQGHPDVFTGLLYYSECIYVSMMHGRND